MDTTRPLIYTIDEIKQRAVPIAKKYGVGKLALFGSYARGEQTEDSDVDFLIELGAIRGFEFYGFIEELEKEFNKHVDVMTYQGLKASYVFNEIDKEVVLYGQ